MTRIDPMHGEEPTPIESEDEYLALIEDTVRFYAEHFPEVPEHTVRDSFPPFEEL